MFTVAALITCLAMIVVASQEKNTTNPPSISEEKPRGFDIASLPHYLNIFSNIQQTDPNRFRYEWKEYIKQMIVEMLALKEKALVFQEMESTRTTGQTLRGLFNRKRIGNESAEYNTTIYTKEYGSDTGVKNKKRRVKKQKAEENFARDQGTTPNEMVGKNELKEGRKEILALRNDSKENVEEEILTKWRLKVPGLPM